ncbi:MAG TPA: hypothetical protein PKJ99_00050 [Thermoanaerobaculales bacterium]|nr:hypothetical protein [Thermoanaerobaculales bacterium]HQL29752.1 hypothetical protein [Thermoanaerobaculales bacterium]HQN96915.1 hypothetical protein [Thermoanaerobaculales bacterium]HQP42708.1 hypothetical protein [Thermoanaerobaculales bacterium]
MTKTLTLAIVVLAALGTAVADTPQEKLALDASGDPAAYTVGRIDRNGGDSCADAPTITVAAYNDTGNTTGYTDNWGPMVSGYGQDGEDQAYLITLGAADTINVTVTPTDSGFDLSAYIIGNADCSNYNPVVLVGADDAFAGDPEVLSYAAGAGTYVIIVDSFLPGEVGPFGIEVLSNVPVELVTFTAE